LWDVGGFPGALDVFVGEALPIGGSPHSRKGDAKMKKRSLISITVLVVTLLSMLLVPVHAGPPTTAGGLWQYKPTIVAIRFADGNTFLTTTEVGKWTGTFEGDSTEDGRVVVHSSGAFSFKGTVSFVGDVGGQSGTLEMSVVGTKPDASADWTGKWVILGGTDGLSTLRGQGAWWGPGAPGPEQWGDIYYSGSIHFEPD
jgi:hypothetical protein